MDSEDPKVQSGLRPVANGRAEPERRPGAARKAGRASEGAQPPAPGRQATQGTSGARELGPQLGPLGEAACARENSKET